MRPARRRRPDQWFHLTVNYPEKKGIMEIKIGIRQIGRETTIDVNRTAAEITEEFTRVRQADGILTLTDSSGRQFLIPASGIGYIEFGQEHARPVGFGTAS